VPFYAQRFGGEFMETSQGDQQQIFLAGPTRRGRPCQCWTVRLGRRHGLAVGQLGNDLHDDNSADTIDAITGPFAVGSELAAVTPCDSNNAPATCPAPASRPITLGENRPVDVGKITALSVSGPGVAPQGCCSCPEPLDRPCRDELQTGT